MLDEILTLPEVASLLKVAEKTVYTMAQRAEIPAFKVRGQWRFKRVDLDRWIELQKGTLNPSAVQIEPKPSNVTAKDHGRQDDH
jgi:excisionase family DNA binding protein